MGLDLYTITSLWCRVVCGPWLPPETKPQAPAAGVECTRCGGVHPLSQCSWPLIEK